ncbi:MAG TPA: hypothetical protein VGM66_05765 [Candidatus Udaeobacter sp.]|jgi:V8-like Glu-specific endopeptidase
MSAAGSSQAVNATTERTIQHLENTKIDLAGKGWHLKEFPETQPENVVTANATDNALTTALMNKFATGANVWAPLIARIYSDSAGENKLNIAPPSHALATAALMREPGAASSTVANIFDRYANDYLAMLVNDKPAEVEPLAKTYVISYQKQSSALAQLMSRAAQAKDGQQADRWLQAYRGQKVERKAAAKGNRFVEKALYDFDDVFKVPAYHKMLDNLWRVGGLFESNPQTANVGGVGVIIGPSVLLTCAHNITWIHQLELSGAASGIRILVLQDDSAFQYSFVRTLIDGSSQMFFDQPAYADLALIEIAPVVSASVPSGAQPRFPPISLGAGLWKRPVYVLAFHKREDHVLGVYDEGHVLFPYQVPASQLDDVFAAGTDRIIGTQTDATERARMITRLRVDFNSAYHFDAGNQTYTYTAIEPPLARPSARFGFDTDTVHGNSGGGVFAKDSGELVGLLAGGMEDSGVELVPSWENKEQGVPAEAIRAFLKEYNRRRTAGTMHGPDLDIVP